MWTIKSEYLICQFSSLRVELNPGGHRRYITVDNSSADFYNLDCNTEYTPSISASVLVSGIRTREDGDSLFFGGNTNSL